MRAPSGDQATARTLSVCPPKVKRGFLVPISQTWTVWSSLAEARRLLSGGQATALTLSEWRRYLGVVFPLVGAQGRTGVSGLAAAVCERLRGPAADGGCQGREVKWRIGGVVAG